MEVGALLPVVAAGFAVPQFVPQILKLRRTGDIAGLSGPWAVLTGVNNAAWFGYFAASQYWLALVPSSSAALLGGTLGVAVQRRAPMGRRSAAAVGAWAGVLGLAAQADRAVLGTLLTGAFLVQVVPAVVAAHRTARPTGIAGGTWRLITVDVANVPDTSDGEGPSGAMTRSELAPSRSSWPTEPGRDTWRSKPTRV